MFVDFQWDALHKDLQNVNRPTEKVLELNTRSDYESYDPPPVHGKPPFKFIPN